MAASVLMAAAFLWGGEVVELRGPLSARCELAGGVAAWPVELVATVTAPADAPADLGAGAFVGDRHGRWFQHMETRRLVPGRQELRWVLGPDEPLLCEPERAAWDAASAPTCTRAGIVLFTASGAALTVPVALRVQPQTAKPPPAARLSALRLDGVGTDGVWRGRCGERTELACRPLPLPSNPCEPAEFRLDLVVQPPQGGPLRLPAYWHEPIALSDRGDRERATAAGPGEFRARYRPLMPGRHRMRLESARSEGAVTAHALPDLVVEGRAHDPIVHIDARDERFFSVGGRWHWPIGLNINSTYDVRSRDCHGTVLTPARGSLTYAAIIDRLAAAGGTACEIWMGSWNLALEWRGEWPGYHGLGRWNQGNAARLDAVLDRAWSRGVRVNLVINNHGQASARNDREWRDNPWNRAIGGPLAESLDFFTDPRALAGQERLRRYLVGRYADHPAILGWKLWSEINLTAARGDVVPQWHEQAAARWHALDSYRHPVSTHWSGDWKVVNPRVADLDGIDYICIDAYRGAKGSGWGLLAQIMADSTQYPGRGLHRFGKPTLCTEYGGSSGNSPEAVRDADLRTAMWAGLVSGHGGSPMTWWWEWVDQTGRWAPFGAIARFIAGEDLRGEAASSAELAANDGGRKLWARAWFRPGRLLGYVLEPKWGANGGEAPRLDGASVEIGSQILPGTLMVEWWDADAGSVLGTVRIEHPGGPLTLRAPACAGHCAFKLWRAEDAPAAGDGT